MTENIQVKSIAIMNVPTSLILYKVITLSDTEMTLMSCVICLYANVLPNNHKIEQIYPLKSYSFSKEWIFTY